MDQKEYKKIRIKSTKKARKKKSKSEITKKRELKKKCRE